LSFAFTPQSVPLARTGCVLSVARYDPEASGEGRFAPLPNVRCLSIEYREGAEPGAARFRYVFDEVLGLADAPTRLEHVYALGSVGRYVVRPDDRLVVFRHRDDGGGDFLFDGFAAIPQADLSKDGEQVTFTAMATPTREWDTPLGGAYMRDADHPGVVGDVQTNLPLRFNPTGSDGVTRPNASPKAADASTGAEFGGREFPTFCGPITAPTGRAAGADVWTLNGSELRYWTLGMAVRYLIARGRRDADGDPTTWTDVQDWGDIDGGLKVFVPSQEGGVVDLSDSSTWKLKDVIVQDFDATGDAWPDAVGRLIEPHGFTMGFALRDEGGKPKWYLCIYRKDLPTPIKRLYLQAVGATLDPGRTNVGGMHLARDSKGIANRIVVDTEPATIEGSFILAPGFVIAAGDVATAANYARDKIGTDAKSDDYQKYRTFIFDELGEGHWDLGTSATVTTMGDLTRLFRRDDEKGAEDEPNATFVHRRRPGHGKLVAVDGKGAERDAELWISTDYAGDSPGLWDDTGTWQMVVSSEWSLLADRLGVRLTMADVKQWTIDKPTGTGMPFPGGKVDIIQSLAAPTAGAPKFRLRLTCTVEDDRGIAAVANRRSASPTRFAITRRVDARDRFAQHIVSRFSSTYGGGKISGEDEMVRDDSERAQDHADGLRRAHERAEFAGTVTIPRISIGYVLGDKIEAIEGRGVDLKTNAGGEQGESDTYPVVVGIAWTCEEPQSTQLTLNDHRAEPPRRRTK